MLSRIIEIAIKRKVTTIMFFAGVCLIGFISLGKLPVQLLPDIEFPKLTIITAYENQSPIEVEELVTRYVEESVGSVNGIKSVYSESIEGMSIVTATFQWGTPMDGAIIETKEKVDLIKGQLPQDTGKSIVTKFDPKDEPVSIYSINSKNGKFNNVRDRIEKEIRPYLERIDGVASVDVIGGYKRQVNVRLDIGKICSHSLSLGEVIESLNAANYNVPAGTIIYNNREYLIRTIGEFGSIGEIGDTVVGRNDNGVPVYLRDVASSIEDGYKDRKCVIRFNGNEAVALRMHKEPGKNTINVCEAIEEKIDELKTRHKDDFEIKQVYSQSGFISSSIRDVLFSAVIGGIIAVLILYFFLKEIRSPLIIATSIPISILGTFALMYFKGITLNTMSLGGLALGVGMMVDDGVVVLESISQSVSGMGKNVEEAILKGVKDVVSPVIASTLTKIVVFLPITFLSSLSGAVFGELALTISFALICSLFSSLTLMPMLYSIKFKQRFKIDSHHLSKYISIFHLLSDATMKIILTTYERVIKIALGIKTKVLCAGVAVTVVGILLFVLLDSELMPKVDPGEFTIEVALPKGTALEESAAFSKWIEEYISKNPYVENVYAKIGSDPDENVSEKVSGMSSNNVAIQVILRDGGRPDIKKVIESFKKYLVFSDRVKTDYIVKESVISSIFSYSNKPLAIEVYGKERDEIKRYGDLIRSKISQIDGVENIVATLDEGYPEYGLVIDRVKMSSMAIDIFDIASTLRMAIHGESATKYRMNDDEIDIRVKIDEREFSSMSSLESILVKSKSGANIPLGKFASIQEGVSPSKIIRSDQSRVNSITANISHDRDSVFKRVEREIDKIDFREGYEAKIVGEKTEIRKTFSELIFAFLLGVLLIYMVLASEFQSLKNPLIIMLSIPVATLGVSGGLLLTGNSLNINSGIGIILLAGTVVNNSIVLFDYIYIESMKGRSLEKAIIEAGKRRIKPILITTCTTIFGMVPLALGIGEGGGLQQPLAVAVIGGLLLSTILTLVFIPVMYAMVNEK
jgi:HAE1 family hydrophobic/amphiphilic exporter-1